MEQIEYFILYKLIRIYNDEFGSIISPETEITPILKRMDFFDVVCRCFEIPPLSYNLKRDTLTLKQLLPIVYSIILNKTIYELDRKTAC